MLLDKALLIKGAAGFAAVGGVAGLGIAAHEGGLFKSKEEKWLEKTNKRLKSYGINGVCLPKVGDLQQNSKTFTRECELTKDQFQKINFSNKGSTDVTVEPSTWTEGNKKITLKIEGETLEDKPFKFTFKNAPSNLTIKGDTTKGDITIKTGQETEFEEKDGKLSKVVDESLKTKLNDYNTKIGNLSLPETCKFNERDGDTTKECEITQGEFKKIKFSNKEDSTDLRVDGWNGDDKLKLKIEEKEDKSLKYTLKGMSSKITIFGDKSKGKIVIDQGKDYEFKEVDGKITKSATNAQNTLGGFNTKLGTLNIPIECRFDEAESDTSVECEATEDQMKKIEFSNKGVQDLKIKNLESSSKIKINVSKDASSQEMRLEFKELKADLIVLGDSTKGRIDIKKDGAPKFKENNGKLAKVSSNDTTTITRLQGHNSKLGKLNLPEECKFDVYETTKTMTCDISKEQLKKVKFWNKEDSSDLTIQDETNFTSVSMEVKDESNKMKMTIKNSSQAVKIIGGNNSFNLRKNNDEFEIRNEKLAQVRKIGSSEEIAGLTCTYTGDGNNGTCKAKNNKVKVSTNGTENKKGEITVTDCSESCFTFSEYEDTYNQTIKFTYTGTTATGTGDNTSLKLEQNVNYQTAVKDNSQKYLVKKP